MPLILSKATLIKTAGVTMRLVPLILFFLFGPLIAQGAEGFYLPDELPWAKRPEHFENAVQASINMSQASGFAVSNDGFVITSLHSLPCLLDFADQVFGEDGAYEYMKTKSQTPKNALCKTLSSELGVSKPRIVYLGKGSHVIQKPVFQYPRKVFEEFLATFGDFAILKFEVDKPAPCIPLSDEEVDAGDPLWIIGYPFGFPKGRKRQMIGHEYVTYGRAFARRHFPRLGDPRALRQHERVMLEEYEKSRREFMVDADAYPGNSGSVVVNFDGQFVGLLIQILLNPGKRYDGVESMVYPASAIYQEVVDELGENAAREIFDCKSM